MIKNHWQKISSWLGLIAFYLVLLPNMVMAVEFDPEGDIKKKTKLATGDPVNITISVIKWALGLLGLVAVIMIVYGGYTWMTAAGNEEKVTKAKNILKYAVIGLIIILLSWAIVTFIIFRSTRLAS